MEINNKRTLHSALLFAIAVVLILGCSIHSALSYFSTYTSEFGAKTLTFGSKTTIEEDVESGQKQLTITIGKGSKPVFVRVKAFYPEGWDVEETESPEWEKGPGGYWYYKTVLEDQEGKRETSLLKLALSRPVKAEESGIKDGDLAQVIVVHESIPAYYDKTGEQFVSYEEVNWDQSVIVVPETN